MKYTAFFILGLIIFITPFLGITTEWKLFIIKICGAVIVLGVIVRHYYIDSLLYENQTFDEGSPEENPQQEELQDDENDYEEENEDYNDDELSEEDLELVSMEDEDDFDENKNEERAYTEEDELSNLEDRSV